MSNSDKSVLELAWKTLKARRGETVTYSSGSAEVTLTAVFTRPQAGEFDGEENLVYESREWDVLIDPDWPDDAPAAFDGHQPAQGDLVTRADGTVFQVQPNGTGEPTWRYSDGQHIWRRVFIQEQ